MLLKTIMWKVCYLQSVTRSYFAAGFRFKCVKKSEVAEFTFKTVRA